MLYRNEVRYEIAHSVGKEHRNILQERFNRQVRQGCIAGFVVPLTKSQTASETGCLLSRAEGIRGSLLYIGHILAR